MQQKYIDILFELQCCLSNKVYELALAEQIGNGCEEDKYKYKELVMYMRTLKRQNIEALTCLTLVQIKSILEKINDECKFCCLQINKLK